MSLHECKTDVSKSRPTGKLNGSLEQKFYNSRLRFVSKQQRKVKKPGNKERVTHAHHGRPHRSNRWYKRGKREDRRNRAAENEDSQDADDSDFDENREKGRMVEPRFW